MAKVFMLNPPFLDRYTRASRSPAISKGGCVYYPMWLAYTTAALEKQGHEVILFDAPAARKNLSDVLSVAKKFKPDLTVIDTSTPSIYSDVNVLNEIKDVVPETFTVLVGSHVTAVPEETLRQSKKIDAIAMQEYDFTIRELAQKIDDLSELKKNDLHNILGISYLDEKDVFIQNPLRPKITAKELETEFLFVSQVYKEHLNIRDYFYPSVLYPEVTIISGRGCPFHCTFCFTPQVMQGHVYRARSAKNLVDEFEWIKENLPEVKDIMIEDDTFTADRQRIKEIAREVKERKLDVTFTCNARADVPFDVLKALKEAGCREVCVGIESGNQEILNNIRKGTTIEGIKQFMKDIKKAGILVHGCFMLGNYGETKDTIRQTIEFAKELDPDTAQFFPIMVYPGTEAFKQFQKAGFLTTSDWKEWLTEEGTHNTIISRPGLTTEELVSLCDQARREFYLRPKYISRKLIQGIMHPRELPRLILGAKSFAKFLLFGTKRKTKKEEN